MGGEPPETSGSPILLRMSRNKDAMWRDGHIRQSSATMCSTCEPMRFSMRGMNASRVVTPR